MIANNKVDGDLRNLDEGVLLDVADEDLRDVVDEDLVYLLMKT